MKIPCNTHELKILPIDICDGFEAMDYIDGADTIIEADKAESEVEE